ncbi:MAG: EamA family transporter [Pseudomonadota bacterium]
MNQPTVIALALLCAVLTAAAQVALKAGVSNPALAGLISSGNTWEFVLRCATIPMVAVGMVLYCASAVLWLLVLARAQVSFAYPLVSLGFVFTAAYAYFALHEPLSAFRIAGIAFIVLGVVFVARS